MHVWEKVEVKTGQTVYLNMLLRYDTPAVACTPLINCSLTVQDSLPNLAKDASGTLLQHFRMPYLLT